jgi:hypothetical protein
VEAKPTPTVQSAPLDQLRSLLLPRPAPSPITVLVGERGSGRSTLLRRLAETSDRETLWIDGAAHAAVLREARPQDLAAAIASVISEPSAARHLVVIDDFDLLDSPSRRIAISLLRHMTLEGNVVVVAVDFSDQPTELSRQPVVELTGLDTDDIRRAIEDRLSSPIPHRVADQLRRRTGGNPLALFEIVDGLTPDQLNGRALLPHPLPLSASTARRLAPPGLAEQSMTVLAALAQEDRLSAEQTRDVAGSDHAMDALLESDRVRLFSRSVRATSPAQALAAWTLLSAHDRHMLHHLLARTDDRDLATLHLALGGGPTIPDELVAAATRRLHHGDHGYVAAALDALNHSIPPSGADLAQRLLADGYVASVARIVAANTTADRLDDLTIAALEAQIALLSGRVDSRLPSPPLEPVPAVVSGHWAQTVLALARSHIQRGDPASAQQLLDDTREALTRAPPPWRALASFARAEAGYHRNEEAALREFAPAVRSWLASRDHQYGIAVAVMVFYLLATGQVRTAGAALNQTEPSVGDGALIRAAHLVGRIQTELVLGHYGSADDLMVRLDHVLPYSQGGAQPLGLIVQISAALGPSPVRDRLEWRHDHRDLVQQPPEVRSEVSAARGLRNLVRGDYEQAAAQLGQALLDRSSLFHGATSVMASLLEANRMLGATATRNRALRESLGSWWPDRHGERFEWLRDRQDG